MGSEFWKQVPFGFVSVGLFAAGIGLALVVGMILGRATKAREEAADRRRLEDYRREVTRRGVVRRVP